MDYNVEYNNCLQKKSPYISLLEAAKMCSYSQEYLSLRARQGKLKAIKLGRNWYTTRHALAEYVSFRGQSSLVKVAKAQREIEKAQDIEEQRTSTKLSNQGVFSKRGLFFWRALKAHHLGVSRVIAAILILAVLTAGIVKWHQPAITVVSHSLVKTSQALGLCSQVTNRIASIMSFGVKESSIFLSQILENSSQWLVNLGKKLEEAAEASERIPDEHRSNKEQSLKFLFLNTVQAKEAQAFSPGFLNTNFKNLQRSTKEITNRYLSDNLFSSFSSRVTVLKRVLDNLAEFPGLFFQNTSQEINNRLSALGSTAVEGLEQTLAATKTILEFPQNFAGGVAQKAKKTQELLSRHTAHYLETANDRLKSISQSVSQKALKGLGQSLVEIGQKGQGMSQGIAQLGELTSAAVNSQGQKLATNLLKLSQNLEHGSDQILSFDKNLSFSLGGAQRNFQASIQSFFEGLSSPLQKVWQFVSEPWRQEEQLAQPLSQPTSITSPSILSQAVAVPPQEIEREIEQKTTSVIKEQVSVIQKEKETQVIEKIGGEDSTKLPLSGGIITGPLLVEGQAVFGGDQAASYLTNKFGTDFSESQLAVRGNALVDEELTIGEHLTVWGKSDFKESIIVGGNADIAGDFSVAGNFSTGHLAPYSLNIGLTEIEPNGNIRTFRVANVNDRDLNVIATGGGNLVLATPNGLHLEGGRIILDALSKASPLIETLDDVKVGGDLEVTSSGRFAGLLTAQAGLAVSGNASISSYLDIGAESAPDTSSGRIYYDALANKMYYYNGSSWVDMSGSGANLFTDAGNFIYLTETSDNVVFGASATTTAPFFFDVASTILTLGADTNLYRSAANTLRTDDSFVVSGALTVSGTTTFNSVIYTWPAVDGSSGQYLMTNGLGALAWQSMVSGLFTDAGEFTYLTATTDDLVLGASATSTAPFWFDVSSELLTLGQDTNLYRNSAHELKTDDNLTVAGAISIASANFQIDASGQVTSGTWQANAITDTFIANDLTISGGTINNTPIGASAPSTAIFSTATTTNLFVTSGSQLGTVSSGLWQGTAITNQYGGTNQDSSAWTGIVYVSSGTWNYEAQLAATRGGTGLNTSASTGVPYINAGTWATETALDEIRGGTGQTIYTIGDILYASATSTLDKLTIGSQDEVLKVSGSGLPEWGTVSGSRWTDAGEFTYLTATTDDLVLGASSTSTAPFWFDVSSNMLTIGADVNLYRSSANILRTDDALTIGGNLTITGHLLPSADDTYDVGTSTARWANLYLGPGSLHLGTNANEAIIDYNTSSNYLSFDPDGNSTADVVIDDNGKLGVGTTTPASLVEIYDTDAAPVLTITNASATAYDPSIQLRSGATPTTYWTFGLDDSTTNKDFVLSDGSALGTSNRLSIDGSTGAATLAGHSSGEGNTGLGLTAGDLVITNGDLTVSSGEASITSSTVGSDVLTLTSVADATADLLSIVADKASGTIIDIDISGSPTLTGNLAGLDLNFSGISTVGSYNLDGLTITFPTGGTGDNTFAKLIEGSDTLYDFDVVSAQFNVPASFNAAGDVSLAYDLILTNNNASYIKPAGPFYIEFGDSNQNYDFTVKPLGAGGSFVVDAATTDTTTTGGAMELTVDSSTSGNKGLYLDYESIDDDAADSLYGLYLDLTIDDDTTANDTLYGLYINTSNADTGNPSFYGLYVAESGGAATSTASAAIYQAGTGWAYGLYIQDQAYFAGNVGINTIGPDRKIDILDASYPQLRLTQADDSQYGEFQTDASGDLTITLSGDELIIPNDNLKVCSGGNCQTEAALAGFGNLVVENDVFIGGNLAMGNANTTSTTFSGITTATTSPINITGITGNNSVIRKVSLYINSDPGSNASSTQCRLSFYSKDTLTEDRLLQAFYFNLTYTETNGGASAGDTSDTVDDTSGLVKYDLVRYIGGTAENVRLNDTPTATGLTFSSPATGLANNHADDSGVVRLAEISDMFQLYDADSTNEIHAILQTFSGFGSAINVVMNIEYQ